MRTGPTSIHKSILTATFLAIMLPLSILSMPGQNSDLAKTRKIAAAQHDIVVILIKKKEFAKAAEEAGTIFQMKWPDDHETLLKDELLDLSRLFQLHDQLSTALQFLNKNMGGFKTPEIKAEILRDKAYVLEKLGRHDEALECLREVKRLLEKKIPLP